MSVRTIHCGSQLRLLVAAVVCCCTGFLSAADPGAPGKDAGAKPKTVELFSAMKSGDIAVKYIAKDSTKATVLIENKTDKPLKVKLPEAFAAVPVIKPRTVKLPGGVGNAPVLAQMGGAGGGGGGNQAGGGGFGGGGGMGGGGGGGGGGFFNVAPDKVGKIKVTTVCLEHGKRDPRPRTPIEIRPLDSWTDRADVIELCKMLGRGDIDQRSAQAAAWHLQNDMSWQQLATKHIKHLNGVREPYFSRVEIMRGMQCAQFAKAVAAKNPVKSPGELESAANQ